MGLFRQEVSDLTVNKNRGSRGESVRVRGGFGCWRPVILEVALTLSQLKLIQSGASFPPEGPVEGQSLILNKETPNGQKTFS